MPLRSCLTPDAVTVEDRAHPEQRFVTVGRDALGRVLVVV
jgi:hypothetical protein